MIGCPQEQRKQRGSSDTPLNELAYGDMDRLEAIINLLRGDDYKQRCYIQHMLYIYEKMKETHSKISYFQTVTLYLKDPLEQARKLCGM
jgi:hypothetical protein